VQDSVVTAAGQLGATVTFVSRGGGLCRHSGLVDGVARRRRIAVSPGPERVAPVRGLESDERALALLARVTNPHGAAHLSVNASPSAIVAGSAAKLVIARALAVQGRGVDPGMASRGR